MAYIFYKGESAREAVERIMVERIDLALEGIGGQPFPSRIGRARKRLQEIRSLLRLVRKPLGARFVTENRWYRGAASDLADIQREHSIHAALRRLARQAGRKEEAFLTRAGAATGNGSRQNGSAVWHLGHVAAQLRAGQRRIAFWPAIDDRLMAAGQAMERTYRDARAAYRTASSHPTDAHMSRWRKRATDHCHQAQLLREVLPSSSTRHLRALQILLAVLDEHRDLVLLGQSIAAAPERFRSGGDAERLARIVRRRLLACVREAQELAGAVYRLPADPA